MITTNDILELKTSLDSIGIVCRGEWVAWEAIYGELPIFADLTDSAETLEDVGGFLEFLATGGNIEPIVRELEKTLADLLDCAASRVNEYAPPMLAGIAGAEIAEYLDGNDELCQGTYKAMKEIIDLCSEWLKWIRVYFPGLDAADRPGSRRGLEVGQDPATGTDRPRAAVVAQDKRKKPTNAAKRLASLQELKKELVEAGLIVDGQWDGSPAEYGELVRHLKEDCGVVNRGGHAWNDCRLFAGYHGSDKSAQNAIESNQGDVRGDRAATIRRICKRYKTNRDK